MASAKINNSATGHSIDPQFRRRSVLPAGRQMSGDMSFLIRSNCPDRPMSYLILSTGRPQRDIQVWLDGDLRAPISIIRDRASRLEEAAEKNGFGFMENRSWLNLSNFQDRSGGCYKFFMNVARYDGGGEENTNVIALFSEVLPLLSKAGIKFDMKTPRNPLMHFRSDNTVLYLFERRKLHRAVALLKKFSERNRGYFEPTGFTPFLSRSIGFGISAVQEGLTTSFGDIVSSAVADGIRESQEQGITDKDLIRAKIRFQLLCRHRHPGRPYLICDGSRKPGRDVFSGARLPDLKVREGLVFAPEDSEDRRF